MLSARAHRAGGIRSGRVTPARTTWLVLVAVLAMTSCNGSPSADLVLRGGTIVDGTGRAAYTGDVAIVGGTIAAVGDIGPIRAAEEIDVTGLVVAPGFINLHSHARYQGLPTAENVLGQGVTTEIINADGGGPIDLDQQLQEIEAAGLAINVGTNVALGSIWAEVNGQEDTRPSSGQIAQMNALVLQGLEQGSWGVAAGLDYKPSYYSTTGGDHRGTRGHRLVANGLHQSRSDHSAEWVQFDGRHERDRRDRRSDWPHAGDHPHEGAGARAGVDR